LTYLSWSGSEKLTRRIGRGVHQSEPDAKGKRLGGGGNQGPDGFGKQL